MKKPAPSRNRNLSIFETLVFASLFILLSACAYVWYSKPNDPVIVAIAAGLTTSTVAGTLLIAIRSIRERLFDDLALSAQESIKVINEVTNWHNGSWVEYISSNNAMANPSQFWFSERLSSSECMKSLVLLGRNHTFMFRDSSANDRLILFDAIRRVTKNKGRVCVFVSNESPLKQEIIKQLTLALDQRTLTAIQFYAIPHDIELRYSCLVNDSGIWVSHKLACLASERTYLAVIQKVKTPYFYNLIVSDAEALQAKCARIELKK